MEWDAQRRVYVNNGKDVSPRQLREWIDSAIGNAQEEVDQESTKLLEGSITVAAFFLFLGSLITSMHIASSLIAYGGEDEMNGTRWGRIDEKLSSELAYLEAFKEQVQESETVTQSLAEFIANSSGATDTRIAAQTISEVIQAEGRADIVTTVDGALESAGVVESNLEVRTIIDSFGERIESIIWGEVESRARSYPDAAFATYENSVKDREIDAGVIGVRRVSEDDAASCDECPALANDEYVSMDEITDIGDTICSANCRCYYEFEAAGQGDIIIDESFPLESAGVIG